VNNIFARTILDALGVKQNKYMNNYKRGYAAPDQVSNQAL
jgi:hypothetical protein